MMRTADPGRRSFGRSQSQSAPALDDTPAKTAANARCARRSADRNRGRLGRQTRRSRRIEHMQRRTLSRILRFEDRTRGLARRKPGRTSAQGGNPCFLALAECTESARKLPTAERDGCAKFGHRTVAIEWRRYCTALKASRAEARSATINPATFPAEMQGKHQNRRPERRISIA